MKFHKNEPYNSLIMKLRIILFIAFIVIWLGIIILYIKNINNIKKESLFELGTVVENVRTLIETDALDSWLNTNKLSEDYKMNHEKLHDLLRIIEEPKHILNSNDVLIAKIVIPMRKDYSGKMKYSIITNLTDFTWKDGKHFSVWHYSKGLLGGDEECSEECPEIESEHGDIWAYDKIMHREENLIYYHPEEENYSGSVLFIPIINTKNEIICILAMECIRYHISNTIFYFFCYGGGIIICILGIFVFEEMKRHKYSLT